MTTRVRRPGSLLLVVCITAVAGCAVFIAAGPASAAGEPPPPPSTIATSDNDFVPVDEELTECISALPPPTCGSESRGGWRQTLVFVLVGIGLAFIAWRIVRSVRRRQVGVARER